MIKHRDDIDGLRGLSILLVVLYHLGLREFGGGFVGVDVFFVISGYVITNLIHTQINAGEFRFAAFYGRRMRRLLPGLFFSLSLAAIFGFLTLSPQHFERMAGALFFSIFAMSNFYFIGEVGYFDVSASFKPLLHTWSLGAEEQFYLIWPAVLILMVRTKRTGFKNLLFLILLSACLISLSGSIIFGKTVSSFFFTPFRIYEFFFGIVLVFLDHKNLRNILREAIFLLGVALIALPVFWFDASVLPVSIYSLFAAGSASLLIYSGNPKYLGYALRNRLFLFFGKISYSLYLIHWPTFVFISYYYLEPTSKNATMALSISFLISVFSYYCIENPFRWSNGSVLYNKFYAIVPAFAVVLTVISLHAYTHEGWPWRFSGSEYRNISADVSRSRRESEEYFLKNNIEDEHVWLNGNKNILILGDSHSLNVFNALHSYGDNREKFNFRREVLTEECFSDQSKKPTLIYRTMISVGLRHKADDDTPECRALKQKIKESVFLKDADLVILANDVPDRNVGRFAQYLRFVGSSSKAQILVFGTNYLPYDPPTMLLLKSNGENINTYMYQMDRSPHLRNNNLLKETAKRIGYPFFDYYSHMCKPVVKQCIVLKDGKLLFDDDNHWSTVGERYYGKILMDAGILSAL